MSLSLQLARHCMRPVSDEALARARLHLLDWVACAAAGATEPDAYALYNGLGLPSVSTDSTAGGPTAGSAVGPAWGSDVGSTDRSALGPAARVSDPWQGLLFRAAVGNRLEMDDVHKQALVHPGPVVIPAALFLAERLSLRPEQLLVAIVRGYEAMICLGRAVGPGHYEYWHNTATCGPLGAAAAACSSLRLTEPQWGDAFGHALTQAAGLWQVRLEPCQSKQWHNARAAQTGVQAAWLAHCGARGPTRILEGEKGFFAAMCPDGDLEALLPTRESANAPGARHWEIFNTSFKPWPACRHAHATLDCALDLRTQLIRQTDDVGRGNRAGQAIKEVKTIRVGTYDDAIAFCDKPHPQTPDEARFSLQHCVAVALYFGAPEMHHFAPDALRDPTLTSLRARVHVAPQAALNTAYPAHFGAEVKLEFADGSVLAARRTDAWGDPERPMQQEDIVNKARRLLKGASPGIQPERLINSCLSLERGQNATTTHRLLHELNDMFDRVQPV